MSSLISAHLQGFFRKIQNSYEGSIQNVQVAGAEDFAISREDEFMFISSDDRAARRDGKEVISGLYYMDLTSNQYLPKLVRAEKDIPLFPHGISMIAIDSGVYRLLVVNHVSSGDEAVTSMDINAVHSIEEYIWQDSTLTFIQTFKDELVKSPNDVVALDNVRFYFTNDHGSDTHLGLLAEDFLGFRRSNVVYFDGENYTVVDDGIAYANGINYDFNRDLLYVASPRDFLVKIYNVQDDGQLEFITNIDCNSGVDNIELDDDGIVWIGSHPKLLAFTTYASGGAPYSPSEIITINYRSKDDFEVKSIYESDGKDMSGATTAIPYQGKVFLGNVMDDHFIVLDQTLLQN